MSAIFQRPLCDMGAAYDYAYRPLIGEADLGSGGGCDDRPHRVELYAASASPGAATAEWRAFSLCSEHEGQLRQHENRLSVPSRFRSTPSDGFAGPARKR